MYKSHSWLFSMILLALSTLGTAVVAQAGLLSVTDAVAPDDVFGSSSILTSDNNAYDTGGRIYDVVVGGPTTLYASANGSGVWKSIDRGADWFWSSNGLLTGRTQYYTSAATLAVDYTRLGADGTARRLLYATQDDDGRPNRPYGGLWTSIDAANSWQHVQLGHCKMVDSVLFAAGHAFASTTCGILTSTADDLISNSWLPLDMPPGFSKGRAVLAGTGMSLFACQTGFGVAMIARSQNLGAKNPDGSSSWMRGADLPGVSCNSLAVIPSLQEATPSSVVAQVVSVDAANRANPEVYVYSSFGNDPVPPRPLSFSNRTTVTNQGPDHSCAPSGSGSYRVFAPFRPGAPQRSPGPGVTYDVYASDNGCFYEYDPSSTPPTPQWHRLNERTCYQGHPGPCIHDDSWGMAFPTSYDPDRGSCTGYAATDGGVYVSQALNGGPCIGWRSLWLRANHGLHAMNSFKMVGIHQNPSRCSRPSSDTCSALYVATADNGAWVSRPPGGVLGSAWQPLGCCGDAGLTMLDPLAPNGVVVARGPSPIAYYHSSVPNVPPVYADYVDNINPNNWAVGIGPPYSGDFSQVMTTPDNCPGVGCPEGMLGDFIAVVGDRTQRSATPDQIERYNNTGWYPIDMSGFFGDLCVPSAQISNIQPFCDIAEVATSGGHFNTTVYVLTSNYDPPGLPKRLAGTQPFLPGQIRLGPGQVWKAQVNRDASSGRIYSWSPASGRFVSGTNCHGHFCRSFHYDARLFLAANVFVDPYHPKVLYATDMGGDSGAVKSSVDGGATWQVEPVLTAIATNYGEFVFDCGLPDYSKGDVSFSPNQCALSDVAFDKDHPEIRVASLYPGGIAFTRNGGASWLPLIAGPNQPILDSLPGSSHPGGLPSTVFYDSFGSSRTGQASLYVALANRSIVRIDGPFPTLTAIEWRFPVGGSVSMLCPHCFARTTPKGQLKSIKVLDDTTGQTYALRRDADGFFRGVELVNAAHTSDIRYHLEFNGFTTITFSHKLTPAELAGRPFVGDCQVTRYKRLDVRSPGQPKLENQRKRCDTD